MLQKLLLVGTAQGWALWALWKARELHLWPSTDLASERALLYLCLALPLGIYLSAGIASLTARRRLSLLVFIAILFPLLGAYSGWANGTPDGVPEFGGLLFTRPSDLLAATIMGFVLIPLLVHFDQNRRSWPYQDLFETAWRNIILCMSAVFLTGLFWAVLFAGSELLRLIGLVFMHKLLQQEIFSIPITGLAFGAAFALALARAEMVVTLRRFQLSMLAWLLPLLMMFIVVWVVALPFTGVEQLFNTHRAAFILLWCAALCISFANAAYQDGMASPPYGKRLSTLLAWAWLALLVVVGVAWWAMWLRIAQYGWSEDRVWGVFVMLMATLYVAGYAASSLRPTGWLSSVGKTNMWSAVVLCLGLLALLSPITDARRIAVHSQMQRLASQAITSDQFDFQYLRWQAGKYGQDALHTLASGIPHPERSTLASKAKQMLAQQARHQPGAGIRALSAAELRQRIRVLPANTPLSATLLQALQFESRDNRLQHCFNTLAQCAVWLIDLNADRAPDAVVLIKNEWGDSSQAQVLQNQGGHYRLVGTLILPEGPTFAQRLTQIERGEFKIIAPTWNDVELSGQRLQITLDHWRWGRPQQPGPMPPSPDAMPAHHPQQP